MNEAQFLISKIERMVEEGSLDESFMSKLASGLAQAGSKVKQADIGGKIKRASTATGGAIQRTASTATQAVKKADIGGKIKTQATRAGGLLQKAKDRVPTGRNKEVVGNVKSSISNLSKKIGGAAKGIAQQKATDVKQGAQLAKGGIVRRAKSIPGQIQKATSRTGKTSWQEGGGEKAKRLLKGAGDIAKKTADSAVKQGSKVIGKGYRGTVGTARGARKKLKSAGSAVADLGHELKTRRRYSKRQHRADQEYGEME